MASKVDRVEREFILKTAVESRVAFKFHAPGRTRSARLAGFDREKLRFHPLPSGDAALKAGESVNVRFGLNGQDFAFGGTVWRSEAQAFELHAGETLYRSLGRRWPRVPNPSGLRAEILLADCASPVDFPRSDEVVEVAMRSSACDLDLGSLDSLVGSFRVRAEGLSTTNRVRMLRPGGKAEDPAEAIAASLGRVLYAPSTWGPPLPESDPWGDGRIVTREMAENFEGIVSLDGSSPLRHHLDALADQGFASLVVSPVVYYRSVIGFVILANGPERPRPLDPEAVDLAWAFSGNLAWFLKRHGYFKCGEGLRPERARVLDASPSGLQVLLGPEAPLLKPGERFDLKLHFPKGRLPCTARVTRRDEAGGGSRYGLSLEGLSPATIDALARGFYGRVEEADPAVPA